MVKAKIIYLLQWTPIYRKEGCNNLGHVAPFDWGSN
jgi:hypothetical protein